MSARFNYSGGRASLLHIFPLSVHEFFCLLSLWPSGNTSVIGLEPTFCAWGYGCLTNPRELAVRLRHDCFFVVATTLFAPGSRRSCCTSEACVPNRPFLKARSSSITSWAAVTLGAAHHSKAAPTNNVEGRRWWTVIGHPRKLQAVHDPRRHRTGDRYRMRHRAAAGRNVFAGNATGAALSWTGSRADAGPEGYFEFFLFIPPSFFITSLDIASFFRAAVESAMRMRMGADQAWYQQPTGGRYQLGVLGDAKIGRVDRNNFFIFDQKVLTRTLAAGRRNQPSANADCTLAHR
jgi:hypothetical protein